MEFEDDAVADGGAVEDRRGLPGGMVGLGGGAAGIIGLILAVLLGVNPLGGGGGGFDVATPGLDGRSTQQQPSDLAGVRCSEGTGPNARLDVLTACVFNDAQRTWARIFQQSGQQYREARLVLYSGATQTGCGAGSASSGPFYCPADERVYIDVTFFEEMRSRLGAGGDFAYAYVVAHEVGHHVQTVLGTSSTVSRLQQRNPEDANELSVRLELQADCFAGVWAAAAQRAGTIRLEPGDVEEAVGAASAIGDDRLQREAGRRVNPDAFTHGSSEQRVEWLSRGLDTGSPSRCNTFK